MERWQEENNMLIKQWEFANFESAWAFAEKCALLFAEHDHHPDMIISYNKVEVVSTTHDAGFVVTEKDYNLAAEIDKI